MASIEPTLPKSALTQIPWWNPAGPPPVLDMLKTDLSTFERYQYCPAPPAATPPLIGPYRPGLQMGPVMSAPSQPYALSPHIPDVAQAREFALGSPANALVPEPRENAEEEAEPSGLKLFQLSRSTEGGGVSYTEQRGIREYLASGYTRRNPDGKVKIDSDWRGKWKEMDFQVAKQTWWKDDASAYSDTFGTPGQSIATGGLQIGAANSSASSTFSVTKGGVNITPISADASVAVAKGQIKLNEGGLVSGSGEASFMEAKGTAKTAIILNPEEATAKLELAGSANIVELKGGGEVCLTPMRAVNGYRSAYNWLFDGDKAMLSDDWDIGLCVGGELSGSVGAQAGANAEASYQKGKARVEAGAKLGLGLGLGAKVSGGLTGIDKAIDWFK